MAERPARKKVGKERFVPRNTTWKIKEKRELFEALKKNSPSDIENLQKHVPTKSKEEVSDYLEKMMKIGRHQEKNVASPMEKWMWLMNELTKWETVDHTQALGQVMSIAGNFESFPTPQPNEVPDYQAIYRYIAALLLNQDLPDLGPLESLVILDFLHNLVDILRSHDTTEQRKIMEIKYQMLCAKVNMADPWAAIKLTKQAMENDFSEFLKKSENSAANRIKNPSHHGQKTPAAAAVSSNVHDSAENDSVKRQSSTSGSSKKSIKRRKVEILEVEPVKKVAETRATKQHAKRGRPKASEQKQSKYVAKPALFTLNPFCIPVNLLKVKSLLELYDERPERTQKNSSVHYVEITRKVPSVAPAVDKAKWKIVPASECPGYKVKGQSKEDEVMKIEDDSETDVSNLKTNQRNERSSQKDVVQRTIKNSTKNPAVSKKENTRIIDLTSGAPSAQTFQPYKLTSKSAQILNIGKTNNTSASKKMTKPISKPAAGSKVVSGLPPAPLKENLPVSRPLKPAPKSSPVQPIVVQLKIPSPSGTSDDVEQQAATALMAKVTQEILASIR